MITGLFGLLALMGVGAASQGQRLPRWIKAGGVILALALVVLILAPTPPG